MDNVTSDVLERFLRYVQVYSESDSQKADKGVSPSTSCQWGMAKLLRSELQALGLQNVQTDSHCFTYALLPASPGAESVPPFCLIAHIDTVDEVSGKDVKPLVHRDYDGSVITLPSGIALDPAEDRHLAEAGKEKDTIITSSGDTLLGADDKAGIAEIMAAVSYLRSHPEEYHGPIEILFSPDEETGHGMDNVNLQLLRSKACYTVDGGHIGELETECFNAVKSDVTFYGKSKHTGDARPDMVNAVCMAAAFVSSLPRHEMPETTDGYMGFYAPLEMEASLEKARIMLLLRDFTQDGIERRKKLVQQVAETVALSFGGRAEVTNTEQYRNMKEKLASQPHVVQSLVAAYRAAGIEPCFPPIRGGTDGSRLTEMGLPTPNIFTGGHSYHSRYEWASLAQMRRAVEVLIQLSKTWLGKE